MPSKHPTAKRILIYGDAADLSMFRMRWFLYDPLIVAQTQIAVDARPMPAQGMPEPDLSKATISA